MLPLLRSATGRIFLTHLPPQQTAVYLSEETLALAPDVRKKLDAERLKQRVAESGVAETESLLNDGFIGLSAPVWNHQHDLAGALTVISPNEGPAPDGKQQIARLREAANALSRALGAAIPK